MNLYGRSDKLTFYTTLRRFHVLIFVLLGMLPVAVFGVVAAQAPQLLGIAQSELLGWVLVDGDGKAIVGFVQSLEAGPDELASLCDSSCELAWQPVVVASWPSDAHEVGEGIDDSQVGVFERLDGQLQLTYVGIPLFSTQVDVGELGSIESEAAHLSWAAISSDGELLALPQAASEEPEEDLMAALMAQGAGVFAQTCGHCHGRQGQGEIGPALAGNFVLRNDNAAIGTILNGIAGMPPHGFLSDREVAAVATFVRNSWGNSFGLITEEEVSERRR